MRWIVGVVGLVEAIEFVDVAAIVGNHDTRALGGVGHAAAADRDEAVAFLTGIEVSDFHDIVVLGIGLDLVIDHHVDIPVFEFADDVFDDAGAAQPGGGEYATLEAEIVGFHADHFVSTRTEQATRNAMKFFNRELPEFVCFHGSILFL